MIIIFYIIILIFYIVAFAPLSTLMMCVDLTSLCTNMTLLYSIIFIMIQVKSTLWMFLNIVTSWSK